MIFEINKQNREVKVVAKLSTRRYVRDPVESVDTKNVLDFLLEKGYDLKSIEMVKDDSCTNYKPDSNHTGEWVFRLKEEKRVAKRTRTAQRKRKTTAAKSEEDKLLRTKDMGGVQPQAQTSVSGKDQEISGE